ncbi:hypothetical protein [Gimesia algae]|uniref:Uncharacterized protein n=1 Tax=Gimesia algae TaxID=2527971 RepID=A0A517VMM9_9PLAN|nr:hypothetical protein [Gimesia algae]QDT94256.1 hypothetical protein Pan161_59510 [Gimesia algae]
MQDILLTGVCHIYMLLKLRHENTLADAAKIAKPDFDGSKIHLINGDADERFRMVDLRGKFGETKYNNLRELLDDHADCRYQYMVSNVSLNKEEVVSKPEWWQKNGFAAEPRWQYQVLGAGLWYHLYDQNWDIETARAWRANRKAELIKVLKEYPRLKFIVYSTLSIDWWREQGFPMDRLIYWPVKWLAGEHKAEWKERFEVIKKQGGHGYHNYPTEESYNDLYQMILDESK